MTVQFDSGALGGARYKFERIPRDMRVGFIGFSVEFDRTTAEAIAKATHPELVGPFAEWCIDDEGLCDLLSDEIERWLGTFPLFTDTAAASPARVATARDEIGGE